MGEFKMNGHEPGHTLPEFFWRLLSFKMGGRVAGEPRLMHDDDRWLNDDFRGDHSDCPMNFMAPVLVIICVVMPF